MNKPQPKLVMALLLVIAVILVAIAVILLRPSYIETDKSVFLEKHSGRFYRKVGNELVPIQENIEDKLRLDYPEGKNY